MPIYDCPHCHEQSVMWDARCSSFLCTCCGAFKDILDSDLARKISLNQVNATQQWLTATMRKPSNQ